MLTKKQAEEILNALPSDKVSEAHDFILFLSERYGHQTRVDESEAWSEEDIRDLTNAVLTHADQTL